MATGFSPGHVVIIGKGFIGTEVAEILEGTIHPYSLVSHNEGWQHEPGGIILNTAGIAGREKCEKAGREAVMRANVEFAKQVSEHAQGKGMLCVQLSTSGVYLPQKNNHRSEDDPLYSEPPNLYVESKIEMEKACSKYNSMIFRIPAVYGKGVHPNDWLQKIRRWKWVEATYTSLLSIETLVHALIGAAIAPTGVYNVADEEPVYLSSYVAEKLESPLPTKTNPKGVSTGPLLNTLKAKRARLLR